MTTLISKEQLAILRKEIDFALAEVAKKHGIAEVKIGTIRYDSNGFKSTIEARFEGGESQEMATLHLNAELYGFNKDIVGATIDYANRRCKVVGIKRTKLVLIVDGKKCTAPIDAVKNVLRLQKSSLVKDLSETFAKVSLFHP